ncbi:hypothetical protein [Flindersiella endophytica]
MFDLAAGGWARILAVVLCGGLGVLGIVSEFTGGVLGGTAVRIGVIVLSLIFLATALVFLALSPVLTRPRKLVVEPAGLRWIDPRGKPWNVPWSELAGVSISTFSKLNHTFVRTTSVRVDLFPGDADFQARHPELAHLWEALGAEQSYRLPLSGHERRLGELAHALQVHARTKYRGVIEEGTVDAA